MSNFTNYEQRQRQQNGELFTVLAPTTLDLGLTANRDGNIFANEGALGMILILKLASEVGVAGITPSIFVRDEDNTAILVRTETELTANGTYTYVYAPGASTGSWNGAGVTAAVDIVVPREWGLRLNKSTGDTAQTFTVEAYAYYLI